MMPTLIDLLTAYAQVENGVPQQVISKTTRVVFFIFNECRIKKSASAIRDEANADADDYA